MEGLSIPGTPNLDGDRTPAAMEEMTGVRGMGDVSSRILLLGAASTYISQAVDLAEESGHQVAGVVDNLGSPLQIDRPDIPLFQLRAVPAHLRQFPAVCSVGTPDYRRRVVAEAAEAGITRFTTLVHPKAQISRSARLGVGSMYSALIFVGAHTSLGDHVLMRALGLVAHNCCVGDFVTIGPGAIIGAFVQIDDGAYIGIGAKILPKVRIGANSIVAAGAVVTRDVPANTVVAGVPAKVKKEGIPGYRG